MSFLDLIYPKKCLNCGKTGGYFCSECLNFLICEREKICPVCLGPSYSGLTHPRCQSQVSLDGLISVFRYRGLIKKALLKLKNRFLSDIASDLVEVFLSQLGEDPVFQKIIKQKNLCLVPVPLHPERERWRGFNQSALLGKMIAKNLNLAFEPHLLVRKKKTLTQINLKEERKENLKEVFILSQEQSLFKNSSVLLFDDFWRTGLTLNEAGKTLKKSGIKKVYGLTLAR